MDNLGLRVAYNYMFYTEKKTVFIQGNFYTGVDCPSGLIYCD